MAYYPTIGVGDLVTADYLTALLPQTVRKLADQNAAASNTTLQNDSELFLPMLANASYFFEGWLLYYAASNTPDIKIGYSVPAGATVLHTSWGHDVSTVSITSSVDVTAANGAVTRGAGSAASVIRSIYAQGEVIMSSTAGNFQVQFAQATSDVALVTMRASSRIKLTQFA